MNMQALATCPDCDDGLVAYADGSSGLCETCRGDGARRCGCCETRLTIAEACRPAAPSLDCPGLSDTLHSAGLVCDACVRLDVADMAERAALVWRWESLPPVALEALS